MGIAFILEGVVDWRSLADRNCDDLMEDYGHVIAALADAGYRNVFRASLTQPQFQFPVVKVIVPFLQYNQRLF